MYYREGEIGEGMDRNGRGREAPRIAVNEPRKTGARSTQARPKPTSLFEEMLMKIYVLFITLW